MPPNVLTTLLVPITKHLFWTAVQYICKIEFDCGNQSRIGQKLAFTYSMLCSIVNYCPNSNIYTVVPVCEIRKPDYFENRTCVRFSEAKFRKPVLAGLRSNNEMNLFGFRNNSGLN